MKTEGILPLIFPGLLTIVFLHCKNIAEYIVFFVKGKDVRHLSVKEIQKQAR